MSVVHLEPPVLDPAVAVDVEGLDGELAAAAAAAAAGLILVLRLALVVGQQPRLQHEVAHVDEGPPDLTPPVADHPPLVHHPRGRRRHRPRPAQIPLLFLMLNLVQPHRTASRGDRFDPPAIVTAEAAADEAELGCGQLLVASSLPPP